MNKAKVFDIQRTSFVDGPGIRTTVFFKGCNLRCKWCHNPEGFVSEPQLLFDKSRCTGCGRCVGVTAQSKDFVCFNDAKRICGREYTVEELFTELVKDKSFYENSGGGVTFSGGECMLQIDFLCEILKKCRENGIHTAVDTAGNVPWESFERALPYADMFLYDMKLFDCDKHIKYTGVPNDRIKENLVRLSDVGARIWIRIPIVTGVNDDVGELTRIRDFTAPLSPEKIELLPYHAMGEHKYGELGLKGEKFDAPPKEKIEELKRLFDT